MSGMASPIAVDCRRLLGGTSLLGDGGDPSQGGGLVALVLQVAAV